MDIRIIKSKKQYHTYLIEVEELMEREKLNRDEKSLLETLALLIDDYEKKMGWELESPDPLTLIRIRMNDLDLKEKDLVGVIGTKGHVSRVLNGSRKLTVDKIIQLAKILRISPATLLPEKEEIHQLV